MENKEYVVVHTIGKVASSSIVSAIKRARSDTEIFHTHSLNTDRLDKIVTLLDEHGKKSVRHVEDSRRVISLIRQRVPMRIVSLIRDPVSRDISAFFENLQFYGIDKNCLPHVTVAIEIFLENYHSGRLDDWFEWEFLRVFGVDVLSQPFPKRVGWYSFEFCHFDFLLMKTELDDSIKGSALGAFLKDRSISISRDNTMSSKVDQNYYRDFIFNIKGRLGKRLASYESAYAKLFYTEDELNSFRSLWLD